MNFGILMQYMLSVGLVGLPNAGKSTLFNLLTKRSVPAENFPFCTIDPHDGIVEVPDIRVKELAELVKAKKEVYSTIEFRDIAGLVKGASTGAGLGNQFLSHIREVDLILMIVRAFEDENIIHVENRVNPTEDQEILMLELTQADVSTLEKTIPRLEKESRGGKDSFIQEKLTLTQELLAIVSDMKPARVHQLSKTVDEEIILFRKSLNLLTDKPILVLANIQLEGSNISFASDFELDIKLESELVDMTQDERLELGIDGMTGLDTLIQNCFKALSLETYLTAGEMEARAWTFTSGSSAPIAAGKIHTDFTKKFIKADIVAFADFIQSGGWSGSRDKGAVKMVGKDYIMKDGDVVDFKIGG